MLIYCNLFIIEKKYKLFSVARAILQYGSYRLKVFTVGLRGYMGFVEQKSVFFQKFCLHIKNEIFFQTLLFTYFTKIL